MRRSDGQKYAQYSSAQRAPNTTASAKCPLPGPPASNPATGRLLTRHLAIKTVLTRADAPPRRVGVALRINRRSFVRFKPRVKGSTPKRNRTRRPVIRVGDHVQVTRSWHSDIAPGQVGAVVGRIAGRYAVEVTTTFADALRPHVRSEVPTTRTVFFNAEELSVCEIPIRDTEFDVS